VAKPFIEEIDDSRVAFHGRSPCCDAVPAIIPRGSCIRIVITYDGRKATCRVRKAHVIAEEGLGLLMKAQEPA
jgi:hypothetical protein